MSFSNFCGRCHCGGGPGPNPKAHDGCCFNYWWEDTAVPHGVSNLSTPSPDDDATVESAELEDDEMIDVYVS